MKRNSYKLFSSASLAGMELPNRLIRSATWDPSIVFTRCMNEEVLNIYRRLALGGVGMIISGGLPVINQDILDRSRRGDKTGYSEICISALANLPACVREYNPQCKIVAQLESGFIDSAPSIIESPFSRHPEIPLSETDIQCIVSCFCDGITHMRENGFDAVQIHAAHGGLLSKFLSPYTNRRTDEYGGSSHNRVRIIAEIVRAARKYVGNYPILIKVNGTDFVYGGLDIQSFPHLASELADAGIDGLEISGGMWDCLAMNKKELGFRPVPSPEAHTQIRNPAYQSYFLPYANALDISIPVILVGGNRHVEFLENILQQGKVDFISLCRPLISEPDLPKRWLAGEGQPEADCISCNSCLFAMYTGVEASHYPPTHCIYKEDRKRVAQAQLWLNNWVRSNLVRT